MNGTRKIYRFISLIFFNLNLLLQAVKKSALLIKNSEKYFLIKKDCEKQILSLSIIVRIFHFDDVCVLKITTAQTSLNKQFQEKIL